MLEDKIYVASVVDNTIVDGEGFRTSLYVSGCDIHCKECHNKAWWDMKKGNLMTVDEVFDRINFDLTDITFIGGEPMMQALPLAALAKKIKLETSKTIWVYSGHTYEEILENRDYFKLLQLCDVLVDGQFNQAYYKNNLKFRGSTNQRIIDIQKSIQSGKVVEWVDEF